MARARMPPMNRMSKMSQLGMPGRPFALLLVGLVVSTALTVTLVFLLLRYKMVEEFTEGVVTIATVQAPTYTIKVVDTKDARLGR